VALADAVSVVVVPVDLVVAFAELAVLEWAEEPEEQPATPTATATVAIPATDFLQMAMAARAADVTVPLPS
jgi:hypothetical protein